MSPWPILRCPMRFTSYLPGFRGFSSAMDGLEAADDSDFDACAVALARSGAFGSEANSCCEHNSKPVQRISRAQGRTGEERRFIRDPWVGRELYTTSGPITTAIALLRPVKVLSHLGEVPGFEARAFFRRIIGSACWKDGKSKARRSICSPQRQAPQSPARSSSGRVWSTGKSKARFCSYQGTPSRGSGETRLRSLRVGADAPSAQPGEARLQSVAYQRCRLGRKIDRDDDCWPIWEPSCLEASCRRACARPPKTRASPPPQAKNGLDGDPGVWAYVCASRLAVRATMKLAARQRLPGGYASSPAGHGWHRRVDKAEYEVEWEFRQPRAGIPGSPRACC